MEDRTGSFEDFKKEVTKLVTGINTIKKNSMQAEEIAKQPEENGLLYGERAVDELSRAVDDLLEVIKRYKELREDEQKFVQEMGPGSSASTRHVYGDSYDKTREKRHSELWSEALKELAVGGDRLYCFVRQMSGLIGEDLQSVIKSNDRSNDENVRQYRTRRDELLKSEQQFQDRVSTIILSSVFSSQNIRTELHDSGVADRVHVVGSSVVQEINAALKEAPGMPFFGREGATRELQAVFNKNHTDLKSLLSSVEEILQARLMERHSSLLRALTDPIGSDMSIIASPRYSKVLTIRDDAYAAIRSAFYRFQQEWTARFHNNRGMPRAYDLIEGSDQHICTCFSALAAHTLAHSRLFSSAAGVYTSVHAARANIRALNSSLYQLVYAVRSKTHMNSEFL
jgi:hypothetical protein